MPYRSRAPLSHLAQRCASSGREMHPFDSAAGVVEKPGFKTIIHGSTPITMLGHRLPKHHSNPVACALHTRSEGHALGLEPSVAPNLALASIFARRRGTCAHVLYTRVAGMHTFLTPIRNHCRCHVGDAKAANVFVRDGNDGTPEVAIIDFQWTGFGLAALDVSHHICAALGPEVCFGDIESDEQNRTEDDGQNNARLWLARPVYG